VVKHLIANQLAVGGSVEDPQTVFTTGGFAGSTYDTANLVTLPNGEFVNINNAGGSGFAPTVNYSSEVAPDIVAKLAWDPGYGHYELFGIARFLHDRVDYVGGGHGGTTPGGIGGGAILPLIPGTLSLQGSVLVGYGIGRYGAGQLPDATIKPNARHNRFRKCKLWWAWSDIRPRPSISMPMLVPSRKQRPPSRRTARATGTAVLCSSTAAAMSS
jgi:hypothetical protein